MALDFQRTTSHGFAPMLACPVTPLGFPSGATVGFAQRLPYSAIRAPIHKTSRGPRAPPNAQSESHDRPWHASWQIRVSTEVLLSPAYVGLTTSLRSHVKWLDRLDERRVRKLVLTGYTNTWVLREDAWFYRRVKLCRSKGQVHELRLTCYAHYDEIRQDAGMKLQTPDAR